MTRPKPVSLTSADAVMRVGTAGAAAVLTDDGCFATPLLLFALDRLGPQMLGSKDDPEAGPWHPAAVRAGVEDEIGRPLPPRNFDRLMAAVMLVTTDRFWREPRAFVHAANVFSGEAFDPDGAFDPADVHECAWAAAEALLLDPPEKPAEGFGPEVVGYVRTRLKFEGWTRVPDVFRMAGDFGELTPPLLTGADAETAAAGAEAQLAALERLLADGFKRVIEQVLALDLHEGSTKKLADRLRRALPAADGRT
jgi:hypothetical protein